MRFSVSETVRVAGKGVVLCGRLEAGAIRVGDRLFLEGGGGTLPFIVGGIDVYGKTGLTEITDYPGDFALLARGADGARIVLPSVATDDAPAGTAEAAAGQAPAPVWPPPPRLPPPMGPLPPLTPLEVLGLSLYWLLVIVGLLLAGAMLVAVVLVLAALVNLVRHWS